MGSIWTAMLRRMDDPVAGVAKVYAIYPSAAPHAIVAAHSTGRPCMARLPRLNKQTCLCWRSPSQSTQPRCGWRGALISATILLRRIEGIDDMARNLARRHQHDVETDKAVNVVGMPGQPEFRRGDDTSPGAFGDRFGSGIQPVTRLDFDENKLAPPARDNVDFADRSLPAPRGNT